jgi:DNA-binding NarL/FixJ family response regulator
MTVDRLETPNIRVLIVKDQTLFAASLRVLLDSCADIEVIGIASTAAAALVEVARHRPDVVLVDCELPDTDGLTAVARIRDTYPRARIVMLAGSNNEERLALRALEAGCSGFLGRMQSVDQLLAVVRAANAGEAIIIPSGLVRLVPRSGRRYEEIGATLSRRELEVLCVMAEGASDRDIATKLFVSLNTARKHTHNIIRKLGAHSKLEAVVIAVREGVIHSL